MNIIKSKSIKPLGYFIFALIIICIGYFVGYRVVGQKSPNQNLPTNSTETENTTAIINNNSESIAVLVSKSSSSGTDLYRTELNSGKSKIIFSDKDEPNKIKQLGNLTADGKNFLAVMGNNLYLISTDGKANKKQITSNFSSTSNILIDPTRKLIAYTLFSNAEPDYGFSIYTMSIDGKNKHQIYKNSTEISNLAFSSNGNKIYFYQSTSGEKHTGEIKIVDISGKNPSTLKTFTNQRINDLKTSLNKLIYILAPNENPQNSEVYSASDRGTGDKQISKNQNQEISADITSDNKHIAYIEIATKDDKSGKLILVNNQNSEQKDLGAASKIIGFMP